MGWQGSVSNLDISIRVRMQMIISFKYYIATLTIIVAIALFSSPSYSADEKGTGLLFGDYYSFYATAPKGWVLDNKSGVKQNLHMVFYPSVKKYKDTPVIVYGMGVTRQKVADPIARQVKQTIDLYRKGGSPNFKSIRMTEQKINGKKVITHYYSKDNWGNYEAAAYILEKDSINFFVYSARSATIFKQHENKFQEILESYLNIYDKQEKLSRSEFISKVKSAKRLAKTKTGKAYRQQMLKQFSQTMANYMNSCNRHIKMSDGNLFRLVFKIEKEGLVSQVYIWPLNALSNCIRSLVHTSRHPKHSIITNFQYFELKVKGKSP